MEVSMMSSSTWDLRSIVGTRGDPSFSLHMCCGLEDTGARVLESARLFCIHSTPYSVLRKIYPTLISTVRGSRVHAHVVDSSPFLADAEAAWWPLGTGLQVQDVVLCTEYLGQHELAAKYGVLPSYGAYLSKYSLSVQSI